MCAMPGQTGQQLAIPVAPGLQPARITGSIAVTGQPTARTIRISAQGRTLLEARAKGTLALDAPVSTADLTDHQLVLALEYTPAVRDVCTATQSTATLSNVSLTTQGTETAPTTVAEFLAPAVPAVLIPVPADPATDVSAAILAASAAMAYRYPDGALKLVPPQDLDAQAAALPAGSRIITITATDGAATTTLGTQAGRPALTITGAGEDLRTAARALADIKSALADGAAVTGMTSTVPAAAGPEQTFTDLGAQAIRLAGYGTQETYLGVNQSQFGGPVSAISLQLRGTHTAVPPAAKPHSPSTGTTTYSAPKPWTTTPSTSPRTSPPARSSPATACACGLPPSPPAATAPAPPACSPWNSPWTPPAASSPPSAATPSSPASPASPRSWAPPSPSRSTPALPPSRTPSTPPRWRSPSNATTIPSWTSGSPPPPPCSTPATPAYWWAPPPPPPNKPAPHSAWPGSAP